MDEVKWCMSRSSSKRRSVDSTVTLELKSSTELYGELGEFIAGTGTGVGGVGDAAVAVDGEEALCLSATSTCRKRILSVSYSHGSFRRRHEVHDGRVSLH